MQLQAQDKRVLITAGAAGIGRAIAETFLDAGARVFTCDIDETALAELKAQRPGIGAMRCDVADDDQVGALFEAATRALGGLDVMVNNAGIAGPTAKVEDISPADWERTIGVNLHATFYCTRRAVPLLKAAGGGLIVNLSSAAGRLGFPLRSPYSAAKFALVGLTESLAMELGPDNIRVNAIQPGIVAGARIDRVIAAQAQARGVSFEERREQMLSRVSLRRTVSAQDIANMVLFLASDLGQNITGQALAVCGNVETLG